MHHHPVDLSRRVQRWRSAPEKLSPLVRQHHEGQKAPLPSPPVTWERIANGERLFATLAPRPLTATTKALRPHRGEMVRSAAFASLTAVAGLAFGLWTGAR